MVPFHETLIKFFKKNFREEIRRLAVDDDGLAPSRTPDAQYSTYEGSLARSQSSSGTAKGPYIIPPLNLGRPVMTPPPGSPASTTQPSFGPGQPNNQTPLQRHLAHLTKHGINAVSSAPGDAAGSDSLSAESPRNSVVNLGHSVHQSQPAQASAASVVSSGGSFGSLRGRFSRFGSLNFGRRNQNGS
ncbi:hypothetical protein FA15DRAFT_590343 [Coprinopsis marcescibilis]|uniref:Uncharacterized protein n=1 Tax=Coprinopsis marcescibilis TaxID=230819 RepID=A0A5C3KY32_COPMA|nr:hypothetical protein FA15DRAFT_590343 [Coprinopsis marcescibilis]